MRKIISVILAILLALSMAANAYLFIEYNDEKNALALANETSARESEASASRTKALENSLKAETALYEETLSQLVIADERPPRLQANWKRKRQRMKPPPPHFPKFS